MPTPTQDYQASIAGLLMGIGTDYHFGARGIQGLGNPPAKTQVTELDGQDGEFAGPEYMGARTLLVHLEIAFDTDSDAFQALKNLKVAWFPTTAPIEFHLQLPDWGHIYYLGQPRSLEDDCGFAPHGSITCIGEFRATDPHAHNT